MAAPLLLPAAVAPLTLDTPLLFSSLAAFSFSFSFSPFVEPAFLIAGAAFAASRRSRSGVRLFTCLVSATSEDDGEPLPEDELCGGAGRDGVEEDGEDDFDLEYEELTEESEDEQD